MHWQAAILSVSLFKADGSATDRASNIVIVHIAPTRGDKVRSHRTSKILSQGNKQRKQAIFLCGSAHSIESRNFKDPTINKRYFPNTQKGVALRSIFAGVWVIIIDFYDLLFRD
jgi:hypothetical protein